MWCLNTVSNSRGATYKEPFAGVDVIKEHSEGQIRTLRQECGRGRTNDEDDQTDKDKKDPNYVIAQGVSAGVDVTADVEPHDPDSEQVDDTAGQNENQRARRKRCRPCWGTKFEELSGIRGVRGGMRNVQDRQNSGRRDVLWIPMPILTSSEDELTLIDPSSQCASVSVCRSKHDLRSQESQCRDQVLEFDRRCQSRCQGHPFNFRNGCRDFFWRAGSGAFERGQGVADRMRRSTDQLRPTSVDSEVSSLHEDHPEAHVSPVSIVPHHTRQEVFPTPVPIPQEQIRSVGKPPVPVGDADGSQCGCWCLPIPQLLEVPDDPVPDHVGEVEESDTESLQRSIAGVEEVPDTVEKRVVDGGLPWNVALRMLDDVDMVVVLLTTTKVFRRGESWFCSFRLHCVEPLP